MSIEDVAATYDPAYWIIERFEDIKVTEDVGEFNYDDY